MNKKPILIQTAMEIECQEILKKIDDLKEKEIQGYQFYEGVIEEYPVVVSLSKVGIIHTSASLSLAIMKYQPKAIINLGIAGATSQKIHKKDIVIGESCININSYRTANLKEGEGSNPEKWELLTFLSGEEDHLTIEVADERLMSLVKEVPNYEQGRIYYGRIGSGDVWNQEIDRLLSLNKKYDILCEDMEAIATYTIANRLNIPVLSLKIISDNSLIGEDYSREVGKDLQEYAFIYLKELIEKFIIENTDEEQAK